MESTNGTHDTSDVAQLQTQLAEALSRLSALGIETPETRATNPGDDAEQDRALCYFLEKLPLELRNEIYSLLLINPLLGEAASTDVVSRFKLSPAILQTSKQIRDEASVILYGENTFWVDLNSNDYTSLPFTTPITRYSFNMIPFRRHIGPHGGGSTSDWICDFKGCGQNNSANDLSCLRCGTCRVGVSPPGVFRSSRGYRDFASNLATIRSTYLGLQKVRNWKAIIHMEKNGDAYVGQSHHKIIQFLRCISTTPVRSLKVLVIPQILGPSNRSCGLNMSMTHQKDYYRLRDVLELFRILRNIRRFQVGECQPEEIPLYVTFRHGYRVSHNLNPKIWKNLKILVEGGTIVEKVWLMDEKLVAYAQAFESSAAYKADMKLPFGMAKARRMRFPTGLYAMTSAYRRQNPYKDGVDHPVEEALEGANIAAEDNNALDFKVQRKITLDYLESQYQRITAACLAVTDFVKSQKTPGGIFHSEVAQSEGTLPKS